MTLFHRDHAEPSPLLTERSPGDLDQRQLDEEFSAVEQTPSEQAQDAEVPDATIMAMRPATAETTTVPEVVLDDSSRRRRRLWMAVGAGATALIAVAASFVAGRSSKPGRGQGNTAVAANSLDTTPTTSPSASSTTLAEVNVSTAEAQAIDGFDNLTPHQKDVLKKIRYPVLMQGNYSASQEGVARFANDLAVMANSGNAEALLKIWGFDSREAYIKSVGQPPESDLIFNQLKNYYLLPQVYPDSNYNFDPSSITHDAKGLTSVKVSIGFYGFNKNDPPEVEASTIIRPRDDEVTGMKNIYFSIGTAVRGTIDIWDSHGTIFGWHQFKVGR